jgi:uncharacterized protein with von Willebrand factor type A (vWA) domain
MTVATACMDQASLKSLLDHGAAPDEIERLAGHLETCTRCGETVDSLLAFDPTAAALRGAKVEADEPSVQLLRARLAKLRPAAASQETTTGANTHSAASPPSINATKDKSVSLAPPQLPDEIGRLVGEEARALADQLQQLTKMLEEAGLIRRKGKDWELTPRATRKIGEKALQDIFGRIDNSLLGNHDLIRRGYGAERLDETKRYTFGDPFELDANRTLMNGLFREACGRAGILPADASAGATPAPPGRLHLTTDDFEIYRTTATTRCSTVIMLDMSYSMMMAGRFEAGRRVALALDSLIRNKFPRDWLRVVAFSYFVLTLEPRMLLDSYWVEYGGGTNFQEALRQARVLLERQKGGTRQIVMITDGEPNTYSYWSGGGNGRGAMAETLREVTRCTREGIVINTFMMAQEPSSTHFVRLMAKVNRGRAFFSSPRHLGAYVLLDYVSNKRRAVS